MDVIWEDILVSRLRTDREQCIKWTAWCAGLHELRSEVTWRLGV